MKVLTLRTIKVLDGLGLFIDKKVIFDPPSAVSPEILLST
jgi:hypothetical protein